MLPALFPESVILPLAPLQSNTEASVPPLGGGNTFIVPLTVPDPQAPEVVTVYGYGPAGPEGVPLIVNIFPESDPVTPVGRPLATAEVAVPPMVYTMLVIGVLAQRDGDPAPVVSVTVCDCTVMLPLIVPGEQPPEVVMV